MRGENTHIPNFDEMLVEIANKLNKKLNTTQTGFVNSGSDFGSEKVSLIKPKNVAVLSGEDVSSLSFGEIWHFFETQLNYPLNVINTNDIKKIDLSKYQVLILPDGYVTNEESLKIISSYAASGGVVLAIGTSLNSFADKEGFLLKKNKAEEKKDSITKVNLIPYNKRELEHTKNSITGSIFKSIIDNTHPLGFGYDTNYYNLKSNSNAYNLLEKGDIGLVDA